VLSRTFTKAEDGMKVWMGPFIAVVLLLVSHDAISGTTGKISGKVVDSQTGEAIVGASVIVVGTSLGAATDLDGNYAIINVPPGTYSVRASAVGFSNTLVENVQVSADLTTTVNFRLEEASVQTKEVIVTAHRPLVQKDLTSSETRISSTEIQTLPVEDVQGLVNLQAGVVDGHFRGGRSGEVAYMIDGLNVNDGFSGNPNLQVENSAVQEIQVISGTFNAEYGQAMSGVVNVITKEGGERLDGSFTTYIGSYLTSHTDIFWNDGNFRPSDIYNVEGSLSGPVPITSSAFFFLNGRLYNNEGYLYGRRVYNPTDSSNYSVTPWYIQSTGDGKYVPMSPDRRWTLLGKLSFKLFSADKLNLSGLFQSEHSKIYDQNFRLNPDAVYQTIRNSYETSAEFTHVFSASTFINLRGSILDGRYYQYLYPNPLDPRYIDPARLDQRPADTFYTGGTQNWHYSHDSKTWIAKGDLTSQVNSNHLLKVGFEVQFNRLWLHDFQVRRDATTNYLPALPPTTDPDNLEYIRRPLAASLYAQDKMEFNYLIVNAGVRLDYFSPRGDVLVYPDQLPNTPLAPASIKYQLSPRLGLAYPITDQGVIHLSYGEFFQVPPYQYLYEDPGFKVIVIGGSLNTVQGNADLKPQQTTAYEVGLQQQLTNDIAVDVTMYYKDIRNLIDTEIRNYLNGAAEYARYVNLDYGNVKGIAISLEKRLSSNFSTNVDYTFQIAAGDASDPQTVFQNNQTNPPLETPKTLVPLNWDRTHSLNMTITYGTRNDYDISIIARAGSGLPYTPSQSSYRSAGVNSARMPAFYNIDLYATKYFELMHRKLSLFLKVYNLLDAKNPQSVFTDTGLPDYTLSMIHDPAPQGVNTLAEYFTRPDFYSPPREVLVGFQISL
jgi:outer membrane receptor protein involved in Fe transport